MSAPSDEGSELATRSAVRISPDPSRVIAKLFVPGEEVPENESRTAAVVARVLDLSEQQVHDTLTGTFESFKGRHRDLQGTFASHFETISHRIPHGQEISKHRQLLIGAYFTHEYSIEGAALCNPSMVACTLIRDGLEERPDAVRAERSGDRGGPLVVHRTAHRSGRARHPDQGRSDHAGHQPRLLQVT